MADRQDQSVSPERASSERASSESRGLVGLRVRALADSVLVMLLVAGTMLLVPDPHEALLAALVVAATGIIWFLARRERDMARRAAAGRWRADALNGRGVSLAEWHAGAALPARNTSDLPGP